MKRWRCGLLGILIPLIGSCERFIGISGLVETAPEAVTSSLELVDRLPASAASPIGDARIAVFDEHAKMILDTRSNPDGRFYATLDGERARSGDYRIRVTKDGFVMLRTAIRLEMAEEILCVIRLAKE